MAKSARSTFLKIDTAASNSQNLQLGEKADLKSSINAICDLLKHPFLYNTLS